jgi:hypothetical protein
MPVQVVQAGTHFACGEQCDIKQNQFNITQLILRATYILAFRAGFGRGSSQALKQAVLLGTGTKIAKAVGAGGRVLLRFLEASGDACGSTSARHTTASEKQRSNW